MRVELALIVGIVCFCCWCVYVIVKMNSSVGPVPEEPAKPFSAARSQPQQQSTEKGQPDQSRQAAANSPVAYFVGATPGQPNAGWRTQQQPAVGLWRASPPGSWPAQTAPGGWHWVGPPQQWPNGAGRQLTASSRPELKSQLVEPELDEEPAETEEADSSPGEPGTELEEEAGRRSFSEDQTDATERDQQGRVVLSRRRHLINGKPAREASSDASATDFERVAEEIDGQDGQDEQASAEYDESPDQPLLAGHAQQQPDAGESRPDKRIEKPAELGHDHHEHRLSESLKAQQWDDDTRGARSRAQHESEEAPELAESSTRPASGATDSEDIDQLLESRGFPFFESTAESGSRRRKRQIELAGVQHDSGISSTNASEHSTASSNFSHEHGGQNGGALAATAPIENLASRQVSAGWQVHPMEGLNASLLTGPVGLYLGSPAPSYVQPEGPAYNQQEELFYDSSPQFERTNSGAAGSINRPEKAKRKLGPKKARASEASYKAAKAGSAKKKSRSRKGATERGRKFKAAEKLSQNDKEFKGYTKGKKAARGDGQRGAKKGALFYKDKGYKKRGFKKAYQKLESGDHKTYFDEFRDKDQDKKWKGFKDKHHYSQRKRWAGNDRKSYKNRNHNELKGKSSKYGDWKDRDGRHYKEEHRQKDKNSLDESDLVKRKRKRKRSMSDSRLPLDY